MSELSERMRAEAEKPMRTWSVVRTWSAGDFVDAEAVGRWADEVAALEAELKAEIESRTRWAKACKKASKQVEELERIKSAFEYLAIESESGVIETEAAEQGGLLSRAEHDKRIARFVRDTLASQEESGG